MYYNINITTIGGMVVIMKKKFCLILITLVAILSINVLPLKAKAGDIIQLFFGDTLELSVPDNKAAKWTSSDTSIVTVTQKGKVTGKKLGYAIIIAETSEVVYYWKIKVVPNSEEIVYEYDISSPIGISSETKNVLIGKKFTLSLNGVKGKPTWKSSNKNVATVSAKGVVTGKGKGKATITATVKGKKYTCKVSVYEKTLYCKTTSVKLDAKKDKKVTITLKSYDTVKYKVADPSIINVKWGEWKGTNIPLTISALKGGKTTVTIYTEDTNEKIKITVAVNKSKDEIKKENKKSEVDVKIEDEKNKNKYPDLDGIISYEIEDKIPNTIKPEIEEDTRKEYKKFEEEWLTVRGLELSYRGSLSWMMDYLYLVVYDKDGQRAEYKIYGAPKGQFENGTIYEGTCNNATIRFQYVETLMLDGKEYRFNCICLNHEDLKKAGIVK